MAMKTRKLNKKQNNFHNKDQAIHQKIKKLIFLQEKITIKITPLYLETIVL